MKHTIVCLTFLIGSMFAHAGSKSLHLGGVVPLRGDIEIKASANGKLAVQQNTPDKLKIEISRRGPASVVSACAP